MVDQIGNRAIIEETPLYFLFAPDNTITVGFGELVPKGAGSKRMWAQKVIRHLEAFSDPLNMIGVPKTQEDEITYIPSHRKSYNYDKGQVAVWQESGRIEISMTHPDRTNVIHKLLRLYFTQVGRPTGQPNIFIIGGSN